MNHVYPIKDNQSVGFISDLHLSSSDIKIKNRLIQALNTWANDLDYLFILGDLFEYWIGDDASEEIGLIDYERLLSEFSIRTNTQLIIMHGNRDFLLGNEFCQRINATLISDPTVLLYGTHRILLAHGDEFCTDDKEHMETRSLLRTDKWKTEILKKTIQQRLEIAQVARAQSEVNKREKPLEIMDVNSNAIVNSLCSHSCLLMIHGHTHRPAIHHLTTNGKCAIRVVLSDWFEQPGQVELRNEQLVILSPNHEKTIIDINEY